MALRAFKATFLVAIDADESDIDEGDDDKPLPEVTLTHVKDYLKYALIVDFNNQDWGNPIGVQSLEVDLEELQELSPEELKNRYAKDS